MSNSTPVFKKLSVALFGELLNRFPFTRKVDAVHIHHTRHPDHSGFEGHDSIVALWRQDTQKIGLRDIAQHITIDPDGFIWLGRNWNAPPVSAAGYNGNQEYGPFMLKIIGDFDKDRDPFAAAQKEAVLKAVALVQKHFNLKPESLRLHNMMSQNSCPGSSLDYGILLKELAEQHRQLATAKAKPAAEGLIPFSGEQDFIIQDAIDSLRNRIATGTEPGDAEPDCHQAEHTRDVLTAPDEPLNSAAAAATTRFIFRDSLTPNDLTRLRPHLINLESGYFSTEGIYSTEPSEVDAIFGDHLEHALERQQGKPLNIVFFAHGGLVDEKSGLMIAYKQIQWWLANGVYPIFFVWETGFLQTLGHILSGETRTRGFDISGVTDPVIESIARHAGGKVIWKNMQDSAQIASGSAAQNSRGVGGAYYTAQALKKFLAKHSDKVALHAVGHSAGTIFHSHFLALLASLEIPKISSLHLLAPAVRTDLFKEKLLPLLTENWVEQLLIYTMHKDTELDDNCAKIYRKSLLYLIYYSLEAEQNTPILGLEQCIREDKDLTTLLGLNGHRNPRAKVVWSPSLSDSGKTASRSTSHGGFDDDPATMNSVLRWVLGKEDADRIIEFPAARSLPPVTEASPVKTFAPEFSPAVAADYRPTSDYRPTPTQAGSGRKRALCIGIDQYPNPLHQLSGCVNDANNWGKALTGLGFEVQTLQDEAATRAGMEAAMTQLFQSSSPGDSLVIQYSGHGTQVADLNQDETTEQLGDDAKDEALCPVDFASGALFLDDDLGQVLRYLPSGVNLTLFMDCCHSGTNTRFAIGASGTAIPARAKARFVRATPELQAAHLQFRKSHPELLSRSINTVQPEARRQVVFAACQDDQVALEMNGSGYFTEKTLAILSRPGMYSNEQFLTAVKKTFDSSYNQEPRLDCAEPYKRQPFLGAARSFEIESGTASPTSAEPQHWRAIQLLAQAINILSTPQ